VIGNNITGEKKILQTISIKIPYSYASSIIDILFGEDVKGIIILNPVCKKNSAFIRRN
jgi:hypothetical protein